MWHYYGGLLQGDERLMRCSGMVHFQNQYRNKRSLLVTIEMEADEDGVLETTLGELGCRSGMSTTTLRAYLDFLESDGDLWLITTPGVGIRIEFVGKQLAWHRYLYGAMKECREQSKARHR